MEKHSENALAVAIWLEGERKVERVLYPSLVSHPQPEQALRSWTTGTWGIVATNRRVFIRQGLISRKVTELRYADIKSIEHA